MASSRQQLAVLAVLALALAFLAVASAARPATAASGGGGGRGDEAGTTPASTSSYLQMYPAAVVVEKARETVEMLLARLPAGPSPKGPGH